MTKLSLFQAQTIFAKAVIVLGAILVEPAATQSWDNIDNIPLLDFGLGSRLGCIDNDPDWKDAYGDGCDWYEDNDEPGCPTHGNDGVGLREALGVAKDNCCYCSDTPNVLQNKVVEPVATPVPTVSAAPTVSSAPTASAAPSPDDVMQMISSPCTDNWEWEDGFGEGCWWYEENDAPGCPEFGDKYADEAIGTGIGVANDNCCYCAMELV